MRRTSLTEAGGRSGYSVSRVPSLPAFCHGEGPRQAAFPLHFFPCHWLELLLGAFLLGALLPLLSHLLSQGWVATVENEGLQAHRLRVTAPLPMGTAWHEAVPASLPIQQLYPFSPLWAEIVKSRWLMNRHTQVPFNPHPTPVPTASLGPDPACHPFPAQAFIQS